MWRRHALQDGNIVTTFQRNLTLSSLGSIKRQKILPDCMASHLRSHRKYRPHPQGFMT
jgi:hypothetical protein